MDRQLPYCRTERDLAQAAARFQIALQRRVGHVVIVGEAEDDPNIFVSVALDSIAAYEFLELSAVERLDFAALATLPGNDRKIVILYDAECLSGEDLARVQLWTERNSGAVNVVLVGTHALAETLASPEARIFAALVHTRVALVPTPLELEAKAVATRRARRAKMARLLVACALTVGLSLAAGARNLPWQPLGAAIHETYASSIEWGLARLP